MPLTDFFIDYVPMYNKFRAVSSILVIAEFTIPLLAILALKRLIEEPSLLRTHLKATIIGLVLTAGTALWFAVPGTPSPSAYVPAQEMQMLQQAASQDYLPAAELPAILANLSEMRATLVQADALRSFFIIAIGVLLLLLHSAGKLRGSLTVGGIALLCLVDLWGVNKRYLNDSQFVASSVRSTSFQKTSTDEAILRDTTLDYRVLNFATSTFNENNTSYWHKSIGGYHAAKLRRYQELIDRHIAPEMQDLYREMARTGGDLSQADPAKFRVLNMLNTRYFIFPGGENGQTVPLQNPHASGNAWFVDDVLYVDNANAEIDALDSIHPARTAVVDRRFRDILHGATQMPHDSLASIRLTEYAPNRLVYTNRQRSRRRGRVLRDILPRRLANHHRRAACLAGPGRLRAARPPHPRRTAHHRDALRPHQPARHRRHSLHRRRAHPAGPRRSPVARLAQRTQDRQRPHRPASLTPQLPPPASAPLQPRFFEPQRGGCRFHGQPSFFSSNFILHFVA